jgi:diketogulonate reductase-like aldo/keto reductase
MIISFFYQTAKNPGNVLMMQQLYTTLNNGVSMPLLGLGTYNMNGREAEKAIAEALETGYRLIDTAAMYGNEISIGNAIRNSKISREELFVTTKVNNTDHGYDNALKAFENSERKLGAGYIDLYLIHWPIKGQRKETWKALEHLYQNGRIKAIGVANYLLPFLKELETYAAIVPMLNQVEFSPYLFSEDLLNYCREKNIQLQSYTPLTRGLKFNDPLLQSLSKKYGKTPAQIILRWNVEQGIAAVPKSSNRERIKENFDIFDFSLPKEDIKAMNGLNENFRIVGNPMNML